MGVIPSIEPTEFYAGDTLKWTRRLPDFPAGAGWILSYKFANKERGIPVDPADVTADGDQFAITIPSAETTVLTPAIYQLIGYVALAGARYVVANASVRVRQDPAAANEPYDFRTQNERILDSINAKIEGREDSDEVSIDGRTLKQIPIKDLIYWQQVYAGRVARERGTLPQSIGARFQ